MPIVSVIQLTRPRGEAEVVREVRQGRDPSIDARTIR